MSAVKVTFAFKNFTAPKKIPGEPHIIALLV
jgi:hypothetical protein